MEGNGISRKIAGYRGGYTSLERKSIEEKMITGELVRSGFPPMPWSWGSILEIWTALCWQAIPGTRASFWQQTGRAGRSKEKCVNYLILENHAF